MVSKQIILAVTAILRMVANLKHTFYHLYLALCIDASSWDFLYFFKHEFLYDAAMPNP